MVDRFGIRDWVICGSSNSVSRSVERYKGNHRGNVKVRVATRVQASPIGQFVRSVEICHLPGSIRDVSLAMAGSLLRNFMATLQAQPLLPICSPFDFLCFVSVLHGERLLGTLFRSCYDAFISGILRA